MRHTPVTSFADRCVLAHDPIAGKTEADDHEDGLMTAYADPARVGISLSETERFTHRSATRRRDPCRRADRRRDHRGDGARRSAVAADPHRRGASASRERRATCQAPDPGPFRADQGRVRRAHRSRQLADRRRRCARHGARCPAATPSKWCSADCSRSGHNSKHEVGGERRKEQRHGTHDDARSPTSRSARRARAPT